jgi:hypothetical protein
MVLRLMDDYLAVSTSVEVAKRFLDRVSTGLPRYALAANHRKTRANFEHTIRLEDGSAVEVAPVTGQVRIADSELRRLAGV